MAKEFLYPGSILSMTKKAGEILIKSDNGDAALLYLCLLSEQSASILHWTHERLESAQTSLINLKLIDPVKSITPDKPQKLEPEAPPDYTTEDVSLALTQGDFSSLVTEVQSVLGKQLSPSDLKTLLLIYDFAALPAPVILTLVSWCIEKQAKRFGTGRKPTMNQIKTEGFRWQKEGIDTLDAADSYIRRQNELEPIIANIMRIIEIHGRRPVSGEMKYLTTWAGMGFADDALQLAYDKTIMNTQKLTWSYMDKILTNWHQKGLHTAAEVEEGEKSGYRPYHGYSTQMPTNPQLPTDDDIEWMFKTKETT